MKASLRFRRPTRQFFSGSNAIASFFLFVVGLMIAGAILQPIVALRIDVTEDKLSSLSPASKRVAASLQDDAVVTLFITADLPASLQGLRRTLRDTLEEYRSASRGRITIREVDPGTNDEALQRVQELGIPELQFNVRTAEKISAQRGYLGLAVTYQEQSGLVLPVLQDLSNFEYDFTSLLKSATESEQRARTIRLLTDGGGASLQTLPAFYQSMAKTAVLEDLALGESGTVPSDTSLLLIAGPKEALGENALKQIDAFILSGGKVLLLYDAAHVNEQLVPTPAVSGLDTLLATYGVTVGPELAGDEVSNLMLQFSDGMQYYLSQYPYFVSVQGSGINTSNLITSRLGAVNLFIPTTVRVAASLPEGVSGETLLETTDAGFLVAGAQQDLFPREAGVQTEVLGRGKQPLAAALTGTFPSAYEKDGDAPKRGADARIVVIGDADLIQTNFYRSHPESQALLLNAIDWLLQDEDLIQIRSKVARDRYLEPTEPAERTAWTWGNLVFGPLVVLLLGLAAWRFRRRN